MRCTERNLLGPSSWRVQSPLQPTASLRAVEIVIELEARRAP